MQGHQHGFLTTVQRLAFPKSQARISTRDQYQMRLFREMFDKEIYLFVHSADLTMWKSSMTITTFWDRAAIASTMRGAPRQHVMAAGGNKSCNVPGDFAACRSSAEAMCVHSRTGSLSGASREIQATIWVAPVTPATA